VLRWARGRSPLRRGFLSGWLLHWVVSTKQRKYRWGVRKLSRSQLRPAKSPKLTGVVSIVSSNRDVFSFRMRSGHTFRAMDDRRFQVLRIPVLNTPVKVHSCTEIIVKEGTATRRNTVTIFPISFNLRSTESTLATSKRSGFKSGSQWNKEAFGDHAQMAVRL
jgi:hypothetical protein